MKYYRLKPHFSIIGHSQDVVELRWGVWNPVSFTITDDSESGKLFSIIKRLDGTAPASRIAKEEQVPKSDVEALIDHLLSLDVLEKGASNALDHYIDSCLPLMGNNDIQARPILLVGDQRLTQQLESTLRRSLPDYEINRLSEEDPGFQLLSRNDPSWLMDGIKFFENIRFFEKWEDNFVVFAFANINPVQMRIMNRVALQLDIPWIHSVIDGPFLLVGPTFKPKESSCFECFETRVLMNLRENASYLKYKNALAEGKVIQGEWAGMDALASVLTSHVSLETINYVTTGNTFTIGKVLSIHLPTMEFNYNEVLSVPSCSSCSSTPERDDEELYFDLRAFAKY